MVFATWALMKLLSILWTTDRKTRKYKINTVSGGEGDSNYLSILIRWNLLNFRNAQNAGCSTFAVSRYVIGTRDLFLYNSTEELAQINAESTNFRLQDGGINDGIFYAPPHLFFHCKAL